MWILLVGILSYKSRFWINVDTIGSLDSARHFQNLSIIDGLNAYFGIVYALFLSFLPLINLSSWFYVHLLIGFLILFSQYFIYKSLLYLNVNSFIATIISFIWGLSHFSTGGALYATADVPLCFIGSIILYIIIKSDRLPEIITLQKGIYLGCLHGIAWLTKTVALFGLTIFPIIAILCNYINTKRFKYYFPNSLQRSIIFLVSYFLPLIFLIVLWLIGSHSKYKRFTLGDSGAHVYELYVNHSEVLIQSRDKARYLLPEWGTHWWSDISKNLNCWDYSIHFNYNNQINRILSNMYWFISNQLYISIDIIIIILIGSIYILYIILKKKENILSWMITPIISIFTLLIYSMMNLIARFLPFITLFSLPAFAIIVNKKYKKNTESAICILVLLGFMFISNLIITGYIIKYMAPGPEHFNIVNDIVRYEANIKGVNSIGGYIKEDDWYHHAMVGFILGKKAAEIIKQNKETNKYIATFKPEWVILVGPKDNETEKTIYINDERYNIVNKYIWRKHRENKKMELYKIKE